MKEEAIHRLFSDRNEVADLNVCPDSHLFIYELPKKTSQAQERHEILKRVSDNSLTIMMNMATVDFPSGKAEAVFPRLLVLNLDATLIQVHVAIFAHIKHIFTRFLELKEQSYTHNSKSLESSRFERTTFASKLVNPQLTLEKWNKMSIEQQFEMVFHPQNLSIISGKQKSSVDPSRSKPSDLPYFIRIVTRKDEKSKKDAPPCLYCKRKLCDNCPLPFNDRKTLRAFLKDAHVSQDQFWFFKSDTNTFTESQEEERQSRRQKRGGKQEKPSVVKKQESKRDFQIVIEFNK